MILRDVRDLDWNKVYELIGVASENGKNRTLSMRRGREPAV